MPALARSLRAMGAFAGWLSLAVVAWAPLPARADERPLDDALVVSSSEDCLTHVALVEHLASWLERAHVDERLAIVVDVGDRVVSLRVLADGAAIASRTFAHLPAACADRRAAVSLAIALAIDGTVLPALAEAGPPAAPQPARPERPTTIGVRLFAEGGALLVGLPDVVPLARIGLALGVDFALVLSATYAGGASSRLGLGAVALSVGAAELAGCYGRAVDPIVALEGCVVASAGAVHAEGRGFDVSRAIDLFLASGGARLALRIALVPWLALRAGADVAFPFVRPRWTVSSGGVEQSAGAYAEVSLAASVGLELTLDAP